MDKPSRLITIGNAGLYYLRQGTSPRVRRMVGIGLNLFLAMVLAKLLVDNKESLPLLAHLVTPRVIIACIGLYVVSFLIQFAVWMDLMGYARTELLQALEDYVRTIFMGRLPGGIWKIVGRVTVYRAPRLSSRAIVATSVVELCIALLAAAIVLLGLNQIVWWLRVLSGLTIVVAWLLLVSQAVRFLPRQASLHRRERGFIWIAMYVASWACGALLVYVVVGRFSTAMTVMDVVRYWCIAGAAGILLQVLPLSTLFRDATLVALLQAHMPIANAVIAAFAVRITLTTCELVIGWTMLTIVGLLKRSPPVADLNPQ